MCFDESSVPLLQPGVVNEIKAKVFGLHFRRSSLHGAESAARLFFLLAAWNIATRAGAPAALL